MIFSIAMGVDNSFYVKSIATFALVFFGYIILVLASVYYFVESNYSKKECLHPTFSYWYKCILRMLHWYGHFPNFRLVSLQKSFFAHGNKVCTGFFPLLFKWKTKHFKNVIDAK